MTTETGKAPLTASLRKAIIDSGVSYHALQRSCGVDHGQLSRFVAGRRDLTLAVASRLCLALGLELVRTGPVAVSPAPGDIPVPGRKREVVRPRAGSEPKKPTKRGGGKPAKRAEGK